MKCNVNHPRLRGVKCDKKRGHKDWHGAPDPSKIWEVDSTARIFWEPGRGYARACGAGSWYASA